jgi:hypothetical protein
MRSDYVSVLIVLLSGAGIKINEAYRKNKIGLFRLDDGDQLTLPAR